MADGVPDIGRMLIVLGAVLLLIGLAFSLGGKLPWLGRLPGDIVWRRGNATFYFPIVTCLLLSLLLTLIFSFLRR
jgi:Protein of unknown function (DUF2905)